MVDNVLRKSILLSILSSSCISLFTVFSLCMIKSFILSYTNTHFEKERFLAYTISSLFSLSLSINMSTLVMYLLMFSIIGLLVCILSSISLKTWCCISSGIICSFLYIFPSNLAYNGESSLGYLKSYLYTPSISFASTLSFPSYGTYLYAF